MSEEIDRWIKFMKENPNTWREIHNKFINAQFIKQKEFAKRILKEPNGKEKLMKIYNIKNKNAI
jgi:hypothetical protein